MCRRILLCFSLCLLCCCCLAGVAMADDAAEDETITADEFLRDLGFDTTDEEAVNEFLTWLYPLEPTSAEDMRLILSGSAYAGMDPEKVYFLWSSLREGVEAASIDPGTIYGQNGYFYGYLALDPTTGKIAVVSRLPTSSFDAMGLEPKPGVTFNLSDYMTKEGFLTKADLDLTTLESLLRDVRSNQHSAYTVLSDLRDSIGLPPGTSGRYTVLQELALLRNILTGVNNSVLKSVRSWEYDEVSNGLAAIAGDGVTYGVAELLDMNFRDLDELLLKNFGTSKGYLGTLANIPANSGLFSYLDGSVQLLDYGLIYSYGDILFSDGTSGGEMGPSLAYIAANGFVGLNKNMETAFVGGHGGEAEYSKLTFDEGLNKNTETASYSDLLHAIVGIGSDLQNPLSQLQAVLAGDSDLELHRNTQQNIDSVTDNFTGSGDGAVSSGDISDASGLTSGVGDAFGGNQVAAGDVFQTISDSGSFNFFSQETAMALDAVTYPAAVTLADDEEDEDSYLDGFVLGEDGFYTVADKSPWNLLNYLGKEE